MACFFIERRRETSRYSQTGYAAPMTEYDRMRAGAYKSELATARRLAKNTGMGEQEALRQALEASAGAAGAGAAQAIAALLASREAEQAAMAARRVERRMQQAHALARRQARHDGNATAWRAWFDGSARPNPGSCGIGARLVGPGGQQIDISQAAGYGNSSEAEYRALIALLEAAVRIGSHELTVYGDSRVVIDDVNGPAHAGAPSLHAYRASVHALMAQLRSVSVRWIPRHKNLEADALSQRASGRDGGTQSELTGFAASASSPHRDA
jgi:ribonuclease HI